MDFSFSGDPVQVLLTPLSPLMNELTTKPAGHLCTAVQLLIARKIRHSPPFTKQADVAIEMVKYFKALGLIGLEV